MLKSRNDGELRDQEYKKSKTLIAKQTRNKKESMESRKTYAIKRNPTSKRSNSQSIKKTPKKKIRPPRPGYTKLLN